MQAEGLAGVELEEVDALADVGVGFSEVLTDFEDEPGAEFELALTNEVCGVEEEGSASGGGDAAPGGEGGGGCSDGGGDVGFVCTLVDADNLRGARGVDGGDLAGGAEAVATDDDVLLAAEFRADGVDRFPHEAGVGGVREVGEDFVDEGALRGAVGDAGGDLGGKHDWLV